MLTAFGRFLRKLRIDRGELIKDMAGRLGVTASYLSAVETGKRNIPENWPTSIAHDYKLDEQAKSELEKAAALSAKSIQISIENAQEARKETAILFAREFDAIDDQTLQQIRTLLNGGRKEE